MAKLAIISTIVRNDLQEPLRHFKKLEVFHYYQKASYNDMTQEQIRDPHLIRFTTPVDLFVKLRRLKPDIIQGNEPYTFPWGIGNICAVYLYSLLSGTSYFFPMLENRPPEIKFGKILSIIPKFILKLYARRAKFVIPLNDGAAKNLKNAGVPDSKIKRLMWGCWGVDTIQFKPKQHTHTNKILFVGTLDERKGIPYLLQAMDEVFARHPDAKLDIIGDGPLRADILDTVKKKNWEAKVRVLGVVKHKDLPSHFQQATLTVTPSITTKRWTEQVGMVNLQSLSCGTPVISTMSGAIPEYCTKGSVLVPEKNSQALAEAINRLLTNKQLHDQLSAEGNKHAIAMFDARRNINTCEQYVLKLLER